MRKRQREGRGEGEEGGGGVKTFRNMLVGEDSGRVESGVLL